MEVSGGPASELHPTGTALPAEALRPGPQAPANHDGADPPAHTLHHAGLVPGSREPLKEDSVGGPGSVEQPCAQVAPSHRSPAGPLLHPSAGPRTPVTPRVGAETHTSSHLHQGHTIGANNGLHVGGGGGSGGGGGGSVVGGGGSGGGGGGGGGGGDVGNILQSLQPVQRSPCETAQVEVCGHSPQDPAYHAQKAQGQVVVACKPSPRLRRCELLTAAYHHHDSGGCPAQLLQGGHAHLCAPEDCVAVNNHHHHHHHLHHQQQQQQHCEETIRYSSYANHGVLEDGFPACCHAQPLLGPARLSLCLADVEGGCQYQAGVAAHPETPLLALPRLVSSVSETGLDATRLLGCCSLSCSWARPFPPGGGGFHAWTEERQRSTSRPISPVAAANANANPPKTAAALRDAGTMTAPREVRDVGVQTSLPGHAHVFPQVCLMEEGAGGAEGPPDWGEGPGSGGGLDAKRGSLKSPVKEVKWDAEGMTWEVYGAAVDPEELGLAIQRHLELQIKETASRAAKLSRQGTATSRHSCAGASGKECGKKRGRVLLGSFRPPACCARTTTAAD
ncbi:uncharacterized protein si:dkey-191g9.7 [Gadus macrocephalus]|uniref:uncharacterized protein si:dkey-191g9.7 n=1 Tax=Gadus macrocephalus TaxID=80720 RepID=UPI0028CBC131|nr:uncharacterized protein si:dkey-191g9.7 [Gadus macrocephalus]XP_059929140.1 uncharacterized protein si:dkey-191g9.7 [Gadus macrocephalus]XP_059929141.1 uncharacterized protein si:dkey-191g9.7 [Gadus macrocephalus]XP_059929142.1 uncharacterized protein si:dkey-191g9.7 [Gadus macrocephalus]